MKKISIDAAKAFAENRNFTRGNTSVCTNNSCGMETSLYLHGNLIAQKKAKSCLFKIAAGLHQRQKKD